jgi:hypothetical protein
MTSTARWWRRGRDGDSARREVPRAASHGARFTTCWAYLLAWPPGVDRDACECCGASIAPNTRWSASQVRTVSCGDRAHVVVSAPPRMRECARSPRSRAPPATGSEHVSLVAHLTRTAGHAPPHVTRDTALSRAAADKSGNAPIAPGRSASVHQTARWFLWSRRRGCTRQAVSCPVGSVKQSRPSHAETRRAWSDPRVSLVIRAFPR